MPILPVARPAGVAISAGIRPQILMGSEGSRTFAGTAPLPEEEMNVIGGYPSMTHR